MISLRLENDNGSIDLDGVKNTGYGVQVTSGATGLGLPPVDTQWSEGAGDGSRYRGQRYLQRDMDYSVYMRAHDRDELKQLISQFAVMLSAPATLVYQDGPHEAWQQGVVLVGGGDYTTGDDSNGETEWRTVITLRSGDPFFTSTLTQRRTVTDNGTITGLLVGSLINLNLSASQAFGDVNLTNDGDAPAYPVWKIVGPGNNFVAISPSGEVLDWGGTLVAGDELTIDTKAGTCIDQTGANRYADFAARPQMWAIPAGGTVASVELAGTLAGTSEISVSWQARKRVMI